jgi:hypothetical protein
MLNMLYRVWRERGGVLPRNRGDLFDLFVEILLDREGLVAPEGADAQVRFTPEGERLLAALTGLAWAMQGRRIAESGAAADDPGVLTLVGRAEALTALGGGPMAELLLKKALDATLVEGGEELRFRHQLLQEYFTARALRQRQQAGTLDAAELWPLATWWQRSGWEEAAVLLAGLYPQDCTPVICWLRDAQPEVAAQCLAEGGAEVADRPALLQELRIAWLRRLTDLDTEPAPEAHAAVGRALGRLGLDDRPGVGLTPAGLPDIDWVPIPGGDFLYQDGERRRIDPFRIARYPVTNALWQAFLDAPDGYRDDRWWAGLDDPDPRRHLAGTCPTNPGRPSPGTRPWPSAPGSASALGWP